MLHPLVQRGDGRRIVIASICVQKYTLDRENSSSNRGIFLEQHAFVIRKVVYFMNRVGVFFMFPGKELRFDNNWPYYKLFH